MIGPRTREALRARREEVITRRREDTDRRGRRGLFGVDPTDAGSVRRFQREHGLAEDGAIGPEARRVLRRERHLLAAIDPTDERAVAQFQREHHLEPDGVIGPETQGAMRALRAATEPRGIDEEDEDTREEADEEAVERRLVPVDVADPGAVRDFQERHGLEPDGVVGPRTQAALRAVVRERELELDEAALPRPERRRPRPAGPCTPSRPGCSSATSRARTATSSASSTRSSAPSASPTTG